MEQPTFLTAFLAGGIFGTILTAFSSIFIAYLTHKLTGKRELDKWRLAEKHKASIEILNILLQNPKNEDINDWTYKLRGSSIKLQLLFESGSAPKPLEDSLEAVFKLVQSKKDGVELADWSIQLRENIKMLRFELASCCQG
ncbi:hypothetical protein I6E72_15175 [Pseudoalteromonas sp. NSLLW24]|jgi:hypothetical protein|uniref:hypothetical protein n=1 Tax=Pseudoalteromonas sp. NSLLW24 TaxID=2792050 RepID=UPI0018CEC9DD|nr:hypothetical protein [Pseudoalteromonas sp. NSLLW24]MBH0000297.1 hypothetical protein [Pseudoalteromonas sp. NSLLW24]